MRQIKNETRTYYLMQHRADTDNSLQVTPYEANQIMIDFIMMDDYMQEETSTGWTFQSDNNTGE